MAAVGCDRVDIDAGPPVIELPGDTVELAAGARIVEIEIGAADSTPIDPATSRVAPGDVVRFEASTRGPHAIVFEPDSSAIAIREFLESTGQMRSPPLLDAGAAWILTFDGAPAGEYPFRCLTHEERGRIVVASGA